MIVVVNSFANRIAAFVYTRLRFLKCAVRLIKQRCQSLSLRFKITFFVVLLLTATSFVLSIITVQIMNKYILNEILKRGESVGKSIAAAAGYSLLSKDLLGLDSLVFQAKSSNRDMPYVFIFDTAMRIIVHSEKPMVGEDISVEQGRLYRKSADGVIVKEITHPSGSIFEISYPIVFMKKSLGMVVVGINKSVMMEAQRTIGNTILIVFGIIVVLGILASSLLASFLIKPIKELSAGVEEFKYGIVKSPLKIYSQDELGNLTRNFNEMVALISEQRDKLSRYSVDLEEAYVSIVKVVAAAIDARDTYTHGHSARVAGLSLMIGEHLSLSKEELRELEITCLLHDVGKIKTPDAILLKPHKLSPAEYKEMMQHVDHGAAILSWASSLSKYIPSILHHHEWYNGKGYPEGLAGNDIPQFAAIIAVADAYDAMTSNRPYRKALSKDRALREISRKSGTQFRPDLVAVFLDLMEMRSDNHISLYLAG